MTHCVTWCKNYTNPFVPLQAPPIPIPLDIPTASLTFRHYECPTHRVCRPWTEWMRHQKVNYALAGRKLNFELFWGSGVSPSNILMVRENQGSWIKRQVECWSLYFNAILKWVVYMGDYHTLQTFFSRILIVMCRRYWGCPMSMVPWGIVYLIKTWI